MKPDELGLLIGFFLFIISAVMFSVYKISTWWAFLITILCLVIPFGIGMLKSGMYK